MRRTHLQLLIFSSLLALAVIVASSSGGGILSAAPQGTTGQSTTGQGTTSQPQSGIDRGSNTGTSPTDQSTRGRYGDQTGAGAGTSQGEAMNQPGTDNARRAGAPWGWIIGSFIVGLIVGGLAFRGRTVGRDRTDFRRAA